MWLGRDRRSPKLGFHSGFSRWGQDAGPKKGHLQAQDFTRARIPQKDQSIERFGPVVQPVADAPQEAVVGAESGARKVCRARRGEFGPGAPRLPDDGTRVPRGWLGILGGEEAEIGTNAGTLRAHSH